MHDFDQEVKRLIEAAEQRASETRRARRRLERLADQLEAEETLEGTLESLLAPVAPEVSLVAAGRRTGHGASRSPDRSTRAPGAQL